jgi:hypothetical protein
MIDDWTDLKRELDRVEGRTFRFGTYDGWSVERVNLVDRRYLFWCLEAVPLRDELRRTILRVLVRGTRSGGKPGRHDAADEKRKAVLSSSSDPPGTLSATP